MRASEFYDTPELGADYWGEDADFPVGDWQFEVANDDTRLGYWDWVLTHREHAEAEAQEMKRLPP